MRQTLFHITDQIADIPVFGVGLLLILWAVFSVGLIVWLVRRQGFTADTFSYLPVIAIVAVALIFVLPNLVEPGQGLPIRSYGVMTMLGIVAGVSMAIRRAPAAGIAPEAVYSFAVWLCVAGFAGARLFHVIEYWKDSYRHPVGDGPLDLSDTLIAIINIPKGGLVVYGSFIGGMLAFAWFVRKHKLPALAFADLLAPSMVLGLAIGRFGCLMNGCCFGSACELPWAVTFPAESPPYHRQVGRGLHWGIQVGAQAGTVAADDLIGADGRLKEGQLVAWPVIRWTSTEVAKLGLQPGQRIVRIGGVERPRAEDVWKVLGLRTASAGIISLETGDGKSVLLEPLPAPPRSLPVQPTQIYSAINALLLCLFLLAFHAFRRHDGEVFGLLITIYPVTRILLEIIRTDEAPMFGTGLSISQIVSVLLLVGVVVYWFNVFRSPRGELWATDHALGTGLKRGPATPQGR